MKFLGFILANIVRDKPRLAFLAVSIISAFMLFGSLSAVGAFFRGGYKFSDNVRIFIYPKYTNTLPMHYLDQIRRIPGPAQGPGGFCGGAGRLLPGPEELTESPGHERGLPAGAGYDRSIHLERAAGARLFRRTVRALS